MKKYKKSDKTMETGNHFKNRWSIAKRTFLLIAILCINVAYSFSQDIITLKNGDDVKALVQEIGESDIKYKKFENQNGPVYSMKKSEILMIRYANGSKDVFTDSTDPIDVVKQKNEEKKILKTNEEMPGSLPLSAYAGTPLKPSKKGAFTFDGTKRSIYGEDTYVDFLKENCSEAYDFYKTNRKLYRDFSIMAGIGFIVAGGTVLLYDLSSNNTNNNNTLNPLYTTLLVTGGLMGITGCIGAIITHNYLGKSLEIYNQKCTKKHSSNLSLNFGVTRSGGVGLTLIF